MVVEQSRAYAIERLLGELELKLPWLDQRLPNLQLLAKVVDTQLTGFDQVSSRTEASLSVSCSRFLSHNQRTSAGMPSSRCSKKTLQTGNPRARSWQEVHATTKGGYNQVLRYDRNQNRTTYTSSDEHIINQRQLQSSSVHFKVLRWGT